MLLIAPLNRCYMVDSTLDFAVPALPPFACHIEKIKHKADPIAFKNIL